MWRGRSCALCVRISPGKWPLQPPSAHCQHPSVHRSLMWEYLPPLTALASVGKVENLGCAVKNLLMKSQPVVPIYMKENPPSGWVKHLLNQQQQASQPLGLTGSHSCEMGPSKNVRKKQPVGAPVLQVYWESSSRISLWKKEVYNALGFWMFSQLHACNPACRASGPQKQWLGLSGPEAWSYSQRPSNEPSGFRPPRFSFRRGFLQGLHVLFPKELLPFELAHLCVVLAGPGGTQPRSPLVLFSAPCCGQAGHEEGRLIGSLWRFWSQAAVGIFGKMVNISSMRASSKKWSLNWVFYVLSLLFDSCQVANCKISTQNWLPQKKAAWGSGWITITGGLQKKRLDVELRGMV